MAQEKPNRLAEWVVLFRAQMPVVRRHFEAWLEACREEPRLIWETTVVRYTVYGLGGLIGVWIVLSLAHAIAPAPPATAVAEVRTADFHVICSNPDCGYHFVVKRRLGFKRFPVQCARCDRLSGQRAVRCSSDTCRGRWVIPIRSEGRRECPYCGGGL